jgi:hypothetical protein
VSSAAVDALAARYFGEERLESLPGYVDALDEVEAELGVTIGRDFGVYELVVYELDRRVIASVREQYGPLPGDDPRADGPRMITERDRRSLLARENELGLDADALRDLIEELTGQRSTVKVPVERLGDLLNAMAQRQLAAARAPVPRRVPAPAASTRPRARVRAHRARRTRTRGGPSPPSRSSPDSAGPGRAGRLGVEAAA